MQHLRRSLTAAPFLILLALLCVVPAHAAGLDVKASIVMDMSTGEILYEQDPDRRIAPASLTKIMTMYIVNEMVQQGKAKLTDRVKISKKSDATGGSTMNLKAGETVTLRELMHGMAIQSGNDACVAVAEHYGGMDAFVKRMNAKARDLGMVDTTFKNPNGLPATGQLTTARDMLRLSLSYLRRFPESLKIHCKTSYTHNGYTRRNSNRLLGNCDGVDGLKTGFVRASGFNIVVTAKRDGRRIIAVVLGGTTWRVRNREAEKVIEASFSAIRRGATQVAFADLNGSIADAKNAGKPTPPVPAPPRVEAVSKVLASADIVYSLQESSWRTKNDAQRRVQDLSKKGFEPRIATVDLGPKGVWHRVMLGYFRKLDDARAYKRVISDRHNMGYTLILKSSNAVVASGG